MTDEAAALPRSSSADGMMTGILATNHNVAAPRSACKA